MVIKLRGYLGGLYLNIGTIKVTLIIGAIGRKSMRIGIRATCRAFKKGIPNMFLCPIHSGEINSERHHPGGKLRRPFRVGWTGCFDYLWPHHMNPIFSVHVRFFFFFKSPEWYRTHSILSFPLSPWRSQYVAFFLTSGMYSQLVRHIGRRYFLLLLNIVNEILFLLIENRLEKHFVMVRFCTYWAKLTSDHELIFSFLLKLEVRKLQEPIN
jgi:hypothetical protein